MADVTHLELGHECDPPRIALVQSSTALDHLQSILYRMTQEPLDMGRREGVVIVTGRNSAATGPVERGIHGVSSGYMPSSASRSVWVHTPGWKIHEANPVVLDTLDCFARAIVAGVADNENLQVLV